MVIFSTMPYPDVVPTRSGYSYQSLHALLFHHQFASSGTFKKMAVIFYGELLMLRMGCSTAQLLERLIHATVLRYCLVHCKVQL